MVADEQPVLTVHVGDIHVGSTLSLSPPRVRLDDGGHYELSPLQAWYWECWNRFWWDTAELKARHNAFALGVFGGDLREGDHHGTTQIWASSEEDQDRAVYRALEPVWDVLDAAVFVRGTPSHEGPSAAAEERYAETLAGRGFPVVPNKRAGSWSWWVFAEEVAGVRFEVAHAPGTKSWVPHTKDLSAARHAQYTWMEYAQDGVEPPDIIIRHHIHYKAGPGAYQDAQCFFVPAWQAPTAWVLSRGVKSARIGRPGGLRILIQPGGEWTASWKRFRPPHGAGWARGRN